MFSLSMKFRLSGPYIGPYGPGSELNSDILFFVLLFSFCGFGGPGGGFGAPGGGFSDNRSGGKPLLVPLARVDVLEKRKT